MKVQSKIDDKYTDYIKTVPYSSIIANLELPEKYSSNGKLNLSAIKEDLDLIVEKIPVFIYPKNILRQELKIARIDVEGFAVYKDISCINSLRIHFNDDVTLSVDKANREFIDKFDDKLDDAEDCARIVFGLNFIEKFLSRDYLVSAFLEKTAYKTK